jgi:hypothetical protein
MRDRQEKRVILAGMWRGMSQSGVWKVQHQTLRYLQQKKWKVPAGEREGPE